MTDTLERFRVVARAASENLRYKSVWVIQDPTRDISARLRNGSIDYDDLCPCTVNATHWPLEAAEP